LGEGHGEFADAFAEKGGLSARTGSMSMLLEQGFERALNTGTTPLESKLWQQFLDYLLVCSQAAVGSYPLNQRHKLPFGISCDGFS